MAKKKTIEQLEAEAKRAEQRAKELRAKAKRQTQAEEAKLNAEIIKAIEEWRQTLDTPIPREQLPAKFRKWAQMNRDKKKNPPA